MATLTSSSVIISVSVLLGLIPFIWLLFYLIDRWRNEKNKVMDLKKNINKNNNEFILTVFCKSSYFITLLMWFSACIIMIVFSLDQGTTINRANNP